MSVGVGLDIEALPCCEMYCFGLNDWIECPDVNVKFLLHAMKVPEKLERLTIGCIGDE